MTSDMIDIGKSILGSIVGGLFVCWLTWIFGRHKVPFLCIGAASGASIVIFALLVFLRQPWYWVAVGTVLTFAFIVVVTTLVKANRSRVESLQKEWALKKNRLKKEIDSLKAELEANRTHLESLQKGWALEKSRLEEEIDSLKAELEANHSHLESLQKEWALEKSILKKEIDSLQAKFKKANKILADAGISEVWTREELPVKDIYKDIVGRYRWLGFSAVQEIANEPVIDYITKSAKTLRLEYIILDSQNELAVRHQSSVKNAPTYRVRQQLDDTEKSVQMLQEHPRKIDVSLLKHSLFPTFRVTLVDDQKIFVGAYAPAPGNNEYSHISGGSLSDFIELNKTKSGKNLLFKWFTLYYKRERLHAEKQALERFVVSERFRSPHMSIDDLTRQARQKKLTYERKKITQDVLRKIMHEFGIPEKGLATCPINKNPSGDCPLGIEGIVPKAGDTIESIFDTKTEYHFVGIGSKNIFSRMVDSAQLSDFKNFVKSQKENPIKFHFVVRDNENDNLMQQQDEWRKPECPVNEQVSDAIKEHNRYREYGWDLKTYKSDTLANFRVVVVDDVVYVSFNQPGTSSQLVHQLIIRKNKDDKDREEKPYNLYNWFRNYVELAEKDVEWKNKHRLMAPSIIEPT